MARTILLAAAAAAAFIGASSGIANAEPSVQRHCAAKLRGTYAFQCHGFATANPAVGLEAVTFVGSVDSNAAGVYEGLGIFNSSLGRVRQHLVGQAEYVDRQCTGSIQYRVWLVLPDGSDGPELPPLYADFVVGKDGREILGVPSNPTPGASGGAVPRLNCRLLRSQ